MATTDKPKGVEVFVRLEETSKEHCFGVKVLRSVKVARPEVVAGLLDTFFDAYERARPHSSHARKDAMLWGDASQSRLDLDALLSEDLVTKRRSGCGFLLLQSSSVLSERILH